MKIYAQKKEKDIYPNISDGMLEVATSNRDYFFLVGSKRRYPYRDFLFYDNNGTAIQKKFLKR